MEEPDPTDFFPLPTSSPHQYHDHQQQHHHQQQTTTTALATATETGFDRAASGSCLMDTTPTTSCGGSSSSGAGRNDETRSDMLLPDDLDEDRDADHDQAESGGGGRVDAMSQPTVDDDHEQTDHEREDDPLQLHNQRSRCTTDVDECEGAAANLMPIHDDDHHHQSHQPHHDHHHHHHHSHHHHHHDDVHEADSIDLDEGASCHSVGGTLGDGDGGYSRLASLSVPSVPSVHSGHSQAALGEDSLSELVTDGQLLSNQLLAQSDDPDLDNAVNSILFA